MKKEKKKKHVLSHSRLNRQNKKRERERKNISHIQF